ncbi:MAG: slipin family protein [Candidatus Thermoplasmatota archaeon]|nr:slipin family protein [Candidatus Thermoplasmatota archaeon]
MVDAAILGVLVLILSFLTLLLIMTINIVTEYQRIVLFRLGRVMGIRGPGLILTIPFIDKTVRLDLRTQVINVPKQRLVTLDNVSLDINAVIYFRIVNPKKAVIQVERFDVATALLAQTILRDLIGKKKLDELLSNREMLDLELKSMLDNYTKSWGVKVSAVKIRDVLLTNDMLRAIAKQAEAERQKRARIIIADGELKASAIMFEAGQTYQENLMALQLRELQTMTEIAREKNLIIVTNERTEIPNIIKNEIKPKEEVKPIIKKSIKTIPKPSHKKGTVENIVDNLIQLKDIKKQNRDEEIVECTV